MADHDVPLHLLELGGGQRALLGEDAVAQTDHADVVQLAGETHRLDLRIAAAHLGGEGRGELRHPYGVAGEPGVLGLDHPHQGLERGDRQALHPGPLLPELAYQAGRLPRAAPAWWPAPAAPPAGGRSPPPPRAPPPGVQHVGDIVHRAGAKAAHRGPGVMPAPDDDHRERRLPLEASATNSGTRSSASEASATRQPNFSRVSSSGLRRWSGRRRRRGRRPADGLRSADGARAFRQEEQQSGAGYRVWRS